METKDRILQKAEEMFMQYGIRSVSMDDISNNLGMSKKTLYQHFSDKDELVDAVVEDHIHVIKEDCKTCRTEALDAIHEIFLTMECVFEEFSNLNPMLLYDMEKFHFKAFKRFSNYKNKFLQQIIRENLQWGIDEGLYRPEIDIDIMSKFRLESMMIPFNFSLFPPGKYNLAEISKLLIEHFIYGLATLKGYKLIQKYNAQKQKS